MLVGEGVMEMAQRSRLVRWEATDVYSAMRLPLGMGDGRRQGKEPELGVGSLRGRRKGY